MQKVYYIYNYLVNYCIRKETHEMQKKWNEYQIIDTRQLVNKLPEDEREQYKFKVLFKNKALTDSVMMFSKADFKKYRENNDAFIVGKIRKRQKRYDVSEQVRNGTLLSYPPQSITIEELISKKQKKNIIGSATMEYPEFAESAGKNGVPPLDELIEDAKDIKNMLQELSSNRPVVYGYETPEYNIDKTADEPDICE